MTMYPGNIQQRQERMSIMNVILSIENIKKLQYSVAGI